MKKLCETCGKLMEGHDVVESTRFCSLGCLDAQLISWGKEPLPAECSVEGECPICRHMAWLISLMVHKPRPLIEQLAIVALVAQQSEKVQEYLAELLIASR